MFKEYVRFVCFIFVVGVYLLLFEEGEYWLFLGWGIRIGCIVFVVVFKVMVILNGIGRGLGY